jgi:ankyrin repeat protein
LALVEKYFLKDMIRKLCKRATPPWERERKAGVSQIPRLITEQDWTAIRFALSEKRKEVIEFLESNSNSPECSNQEDTQDQTVLNLCCRFHPPLDVVQAFHECNTNAINQADRAGRYPIHTACYHGASSAVIAFLLQANQLAAETQDEMGKTPLHLTCEHYAKNFDPVLAKKHKSSKDEAIIEVTRLLCMVAPNTVNLEDDEDQSPLEIAIDSGAPLRMIKKLQKVSEKDWKDRRGIGSHDNIRETLKLQVTDSRKRLEMLAAAKVVDLSLSLSDSKKVNPHSDNVLGTEAVLRSSGIIRNSMSISLKPRFRQATRAHAA